jgi:transcriptional regulator GlxA family with amidase domain
VSLASRLLTRTHGAVGVGALKARYGVSARQFDRAFTRQVGMAPKVYARMLRFQRALALKQAGSASSWTQVAQAAGYFDQAHMIRDFRAFADATPTQFFAALVPAEAQAVKGPPGENIQSATPREV